ncbi:MAG: peptide ABC transporter substrate-binding protein [Patescibacteria group bacterium]
MNAFVVRLRALVKRVFFWWPSAAPSEERAPDASSDHALVVAVTSPRKVPTLRQLRYAPRVLTMRERRIGWLSIALLLVSGGLALGVTVEERTVRVPVVGGTISEALIGEPSVINPIDAPGNDVDRDIASLVFSGLFRMDGMQAAPDLAERYEWSEDGKTLTVVIREDARFHSGDPVTADDVQFTVESIQDPARSSPLASSFRKVKAIATDERTVQFQLETPDLQFLTSLTVGILPSELWQDIPAANARLADLNMRPIGSGPYRFKSYTRDAKGSIRSYTLERDDHWYGVKPYLKTVVFQFYPDRKQAEDALRADLVQALAFSPLKDDTQGDSVRWHRIQLELPQETVAFFNVKQKLLSDERVRRALAGVVDRQEIVDAWRGRAVPIGGPYPFSTATSTPLTLDEGRALLDAAGWKLSESGDVRTLGKASASSTVSTLELTILTPDQAELIAVADVLQRRWSLLGVKVTVVPLEPETFVHRATIERDGHVIVTNVLLGPEQDLFPFWWSSQATARGLNISGLADRDVDMLLATARDATSTSAQQDARTSLSDAIRKSTPAIFLVRPSSPYLVSKKIMGVTETLSVSRPADRFHDLMHWYVKTGWRWK